MKIQDVEGSPFPNISPAEPVKQKANFSERVPETAEAGDIYINVMQGLQKIVQHQSEDTPVSSRLLSKMEDTLNRAIFFEGSYPGLWIARGQLYILQGEFEKSIESFTEAIELEEGFTDIFWSPGDVFLGRGWASYFLGDVEKASQDWKQAAEMGNEIAKELIQIYQ